MDDFTFWLKCGLWPNFTSAKRLSKRLSQKVKSPILNKMCLEQISVCTTLAIHCTGIEILSVRLSICCCNIKCTVFPIFWASTLLNCTQTENLTIPKSYQHTTDRKTERASVQNVVFQTAAIGQVDNWLLQLVTDWNAYVTIGVLQMHDGAADDEDWERTFNGPAAVVLIKQMRRQRTDLLTTLRAATAERMTRKLQRTASAVNAAITRATPRLQQQPLHH